MKRILAILLVLMLAFSIVACKKEPIDCAHIDINVDGICDFCGAEVEIPETPDNGGSEGGIDLPLIPANPAD